MSHSNDRGWETWAILIEDGIPSELLGTVEGFAATFKTREKARKRIKEIRAHNKRVYRKDPPMRIVRLWITIQEE